MVTLFFIPDAWPTTVELVDLELKLVIFEAMECHTQDTPKPLIKISSSHHSTSLNFQCPHL